MSERYLFSSVINGGEVCGASIVTIKGCNDIEITPFNREEAGIPYIEGIGLIAREYYIQTYLGQRFPPRSEGEGFRDYIKRIAGIAAIQGAFTKDECDDSNGCAVIVDSELRAFRNS